MSEQKYKKYFNLSSPILICGETGTGKSRLAQELYRQSIINKEKFLTMHLASIKEELFESELFGHKKGAFTGAVENKNGYLQEVGTGTLFLDEIGELSIESQKKLLYILEEKKFVPVGDVNTRDFRGRLICATNKNLEQMVKEGKFREDLYYRLMIFQIRLDAIRDNRPELKAKIQTYFYDYKKLYLHSGLRLSGELQNFLENYHWPGNTRELKNCLESLVGLNECGELRMTDLPLWMIDKNLSTLTDGHQYSDKYSEAMEKFEEIYLRHMLEKYQGQVNKTARSIQISKVNLINKARKYQINTLKMRVNAGDNVEIKAA